MEIVTSKEQATESVQGGELNTTQSGVLSSSGVEVITASGVPVPTPFRDIAYTITDKYHPPFHVYASANGWWMDQVKVRDLIKAFKNGHSVENAKAYAGISQEQWQYFNDLHPDFYSVREAVSGLIEMSAMEIINEDIVQNRSIESSWKYVQRRDRLIGRAIKERGGLNVNVEPGGQAVIQQTNNGNNSDTNDSNIDESKVEDAISRIVARVRQRITS